MKIVTWILMPAILLATSVLYGQSSGNKAFGQVFAAQGHTYANRPGNKKCVLLYFNLPFFSIRRIKKADEWQLVPAFSIGNGGLDVIGRSEWNGANAQGA